MQQCKEHEQPGGGPWMKKNINLPWHVMSDWLSNDGIVAGIFTIVSILGSEQLFTWAVEGYGHAKRFIRILDDMNIQQCGDIIPAPKMIELIFLVLFRRGGEEQQEDGAFSAGDPATTRTYSTGQERLRLAASRDQQGGNYGIMSRATCSGPGGGNQLSKSRSLVVADGGREETTYYHSRAGGGSVSGSSMAFHSCYGDERISLASPAPALRGSVGASRVDFGDQVELAPPEPDESTQARRANLVVQSSATASSPVDVVQENHSGMFFVKNATQADYERVYQVFKGLIYGNGLDSDACKELLSKAFPVWYTNNAFDIDRGLRIINRIAIPVPMPPIAPSRALDSNLASPPLQAWLDKLPTAGELYRQCDSDATNRICSTKTGRTTCSSSSKTTTSSPVLTAVVALAPYLSRAQLQYLVEHGFIAANAGSTEQKHRLSYVLHLKKVLSTIVDDIGGNSLLPQTHGIAFLLGDTLKRSASLGEHQEKQKHRSNANSDATSLTSCSSKNIVSVFGSSLLGPEDMAGLLRAILSAPSFGHFAQRALRTLMELLQRQPLIFVRGVFYELSLNGSQRVLAGLLMRLLEAPQDCFRVEVDYHGMLASMLDIHSIPKRGDYMAGGKYQRRSYYEAIYRIAANLIDESDDYLAFKQHLTANIQEDGGAVADEEHEEEEEAQGCATSAKDEGTTHGSPVVRSDAKSGTVALAAATNTSTTTTSTSIKKIAAVVSNSSYRSQFLLTNSDFADLLQAALAAVVHADRVGCAWLRNATSTTSQESRTTSTSSPSTPLKSPSSTSTTPTRRAVTAAYRQAFDLCREAVSRDKRALIRETWLKDFYERNYEALVIFSIVRNVVDGTDHIRKWITVQPCFEAHYSNVGLLDGNEKKKDKKEENYVEMNGTTVDVEGDEDEEQAVVGAGVKPEDAERATATYKLGLSPVTGEQLGASPLGPHPAAASKGTTTTTPSSNLKNENNKSSSTSALSALDQFHADLKELEKSLIPFSANPQEAEARVRRLYPDESYRMWWNGPLQEKEHDHQCPSSVLRTQQILRRLAHLAIDANYFYQSDRQLMHLDPLVLALIYELPPLPAAPSAETRNTKTRNPLEKFAIISGMGVITDGESGHEMNKTFDRLYKEYKVRVFRSDTGIARHIEYNASRIETAVGKAMAAGVRHWGWIGYSQGCANMWKAESNLNTGTPDMRKALQGLCCRNQMYSAANGTPMGTSLEWRVSEGIAEFEIFLKNLQLHISNNLNRVLMHLLSSLLASRGFVFLIGGLHSLNNMACIRGLWRGAKHKANVPTLAVRAVSEQHTMPEVLTFMCNYLSTVAKNVQPDKRKRGPGVIERDESCPYDFGGLLKKMRERAPVPSSGSAAAAESEETTTPKTVDTETPLTTLEQVMNRRKKRRGEKEDFVSWDQMVEPDGATWPQEKAITTTANTTVEAQKSLSSKPTGEPQGTTEKSFNPFLSLRPAEPINHDSQVTALESEGYPCYVRNKNGRMLKRCAIRNMLHRGHHWVPLREIETGFVETDLDRARQVYQGPMDKLVFPFVMVNSRFGVIPRDEEEQQQEEGEEKEGKEEEGEEEKGEEEEGEELKR
ncbi:unnamed protein product [Amoebophrya sp. A25]|nr:unnamed protein product [Amoebophrya sp. A25]|eukprot:GSA25T00003337001.1